MTRRETGPKGFQAEFIKMLEKLYPGAIVLKNDPNYRQGIPDVLMLIHDTWAAFEVKAHRTARRQPNQEEYIALMDGMSFASFVYPENVSQVLDELQRSLSARRTARLSKRQQVSLGQLRPRKAGQHVPQLAANSAGN
jgi:hypothetical protein